MFIEGKVAVVIGGAGGIGRACCEALISKGAKVCVGDISDDAGRGLVEEFNSPTCRQIAVYAKCDVGNGGDIKDLFELAYNTFGQVDICISIAGCFDEEDWQKNLDINVGGMIRVVGAARDYMSTAKGGRGGVVMLTSSVAGLVEVPFFPVYAACKHAVVGYCRSLGTPKHYAKDGVRYNCICPTAVNTSFLDLSKCLFQEDLEKFRLSIVGKYLSPEEVAAAFMKAIEEDGWNGQAVVVSRAKGICLAKFEDQPVQ